MDKNNDDYDDYEEYDVDEDDDEGDDDYDYDEGNVDNDKRNWLCESSFYEEPTGNAQLSRRKVKLSQKIEKNRNVLDNTTHNVRIRSKWKQSNTNKYRYQVAFSTLPIHEEDDEEPIPSTSTVDVHNSLSTQNFETKKDSVIVDNGHQKHVIVHIDDSSDDDNDYDIHFDRKKREEMCENESLLVAYDTV